MHSPYLRCIKRVFSLLVWHMHGHYACRKNIACGFKCFGCTKTSKHSQQRTRGRGTRELAFTTLFECYHATEWSLSALISFLLLGLPLLMALLDFSDCDYLRLWFPRSLGPLFLTLNIVLWITELRIVDTALCFKDRDLDFWILLIVRLS